MPDWLEFVRQRLSGLALNSKEKEEVHLELAAHLQESYETFRSEGLADHEAVQRTLAGSLRGPHDRAYVFPVYTAWLLLLPFVGALGAYLSDRAGGTKRAVVISGIFPAFAFFVVLLLVIPFMGILEHGLDAGARSVFDSLTCEPFGRLGVVAGWVLVPGTCLWIGVQACLFFSRRLTPPGVATN